MFLRALQIEKKNASELYKCTGGGRLHCRRSLHPWPVAVFRDFPIFLFDFGLDRGVCQGGLRRILILRLRQVGSSYCVFQAFLCTLVVVGLVWVVFMLLHEVSEGIQESILITCFTCLTRFIGLN